MTKTLKDLFRCPHLMDTQTPAPVKTDKQKAIDKLIDLVENGEWEYSHESTCLGVSIYYINKQNNIRIYHSYYRRILEIFQNEKWSSIEFLTFEEQEQIIDRWYARKDAEYKKEKEESDKKQLAEFLRA